MSLFSFFLGEKKKTSTLAKERLQFILMHERSARTTASPDFLPELQREHIFEKFYRLPGASERSGGVGLGLSLVRSIAERHGGTVYCTDRLDGQSGASFVIELPLD